MLIETREIPVRGRANGRAALQLEICDRYSAILAGSGVFFRAAGISSVFTVLAAKRGMGSWGLCSSVKRKRKRW